MTYYPKIAELEYKDKNISITLPMRVKLIELVSYKCPNCRLNGTMTAIFQYCLARLYKHFNFYYKEELKMSRPQEICISDTELCCPDCLVFKKTKIKLDAISRKIFKIYVNSTPKFIDAGRILQIYTPFKWKAKMKDIVTGKLGLSTYAETLEEMYSALYEEQESLEKRKVKCAKLRIFDIPKKRIMKDFEQYNMRRVARRI